MHGANRQGRRAAARPAICIRQLESTQTTVLAPVRTMESILVRAMAPETSGEFHREGAAESAALLGGVHLAQFQTAHIGQQTARAFLDVEFAQRVATVVIGDDAFEARADVLHLATSRRNCENSQTRGATCCAAARRSGSSGKSCVEMVRDHRRAGTGRNHDIFGIAEDFEKMPRQLARFVAIAGIEGRLAAAGLAFAENRRCSRDAPAPPPWRCPPSGKN